MSLTGPSPDEPTRIGVPIADLAGMYGAYGVVSALYERAQTGHGGIVRTSCWPRSPASMPSRAPATPWLVRSARPGQSSSIACTVRLLPLPRRDRVGAQLIVADLRQQIIRGTCGVMTHFPLRTN